MAGSFVGFVFLSSFWIFFGKIRKIKNWQNKQLVSYLKDKNFTTPLTNAPLYEKYFYFSNKLNKPVGCWFRYRICFQFNFKTDSMRQSQLISWFGFTKCIHHDFYVIFLLLSPFDFFANFKANMRAFSDQLCKACKRFSNRRIWLDKYMWLNASILLMSHYWVSLQFSSHCIIRNGHKALASRAVYVMVFIN